MNYKKKSTEARNFDADQQLNPSLTGFKFNSKNLKFQCLNCKAQEARSGGQS